MSSARATPNGTRSLMRLTYTCGEHPVQSFETTSCHNYLAQGENLWWQDYLARSANGGPRTNDVSLATAADSGGTPLNSGQLRELLMRLVGVPR